MKNIILSFVVLAVLCSCSNPQNDIKKYLEKNAPVLNSLEFIEVSGMDSIYSPLLDLWDAQSLCSELGLIVTTAWDEAGDREYRTRVDFVVDSLSNKFNYIDSVLMNAERILRMKDFKLDIGRNNTKGVKAKYRINGMLRTDWFYYGSDGDIYNSTIEVEKEYMVLGKEIKLMDDNIRLLKKYH